MRSFCHRVSCYRTILRKEKKEGTSQELSPPPKIPAATPKQPSLENAKKYFDEGVAYEKDKNIMKQFPHTQRLLNQIGTMKTLTPIVGIQDV